MTKNHSSNNIVGNTYRFIGKENEYFIVDVSGVKDGNIAYGKIIERSAYFHTQSQLYPYDKNIDFTILTHPGNWQLVFKKKHVDKYTHLCYLLGLEE